MRVIRGLFVCALTAALIGVGATTASAAPVDAAGVISAGLDSGRVELDPSAEYAETSLSQTFTITTAPGGVFTLTSSGTDRPRLPFGAGGLFTFVNGTGGPLEIVLDGIEFDGTTTGGGVRFGPTTGVAMTAATITDCVFRNIPGSAVSQGKLTTLTVDRTVFEDNGGTGIVAGGALYYDGSAGSFSTAIIRDSTFDGNSAFHDGYVGGAVHFQTGTSITVERSLFRDNHGGYRGGALGVYAANAAISIVDSLFDGNSVVDRGRIAWGDGGAVHLVTKQPSSITGSTFVGNSASDDGGALFLYDLNEQGATTSLFEVSNSTFVDNTANNIGNEVFGDGGGAIEVYGGTTRFTHNTFVGNAVLGCAASGGTCYGGAISGDTYGEQNLEFANNLFVDNVASPAGAGYDSVFAAGEWKGTGSRITDLGGNLGLDGGAVIDYPAASEVFWDSSTTPAANGSTRVVGAPGATAPLTTVLIAPGGTADNAGDPAHATVSDQRGATRGTTPDAGAVDISWVRFEANGGSFGMLSPSAGWYQPASSTRYGMTVAATPLAAPAGTGITGPAERTFAGWSTAADGDVVYTEGQAIPEGATVFAVWVDTQRPGPEEPEPGPEPTPETPVTPPAGEESSPAVLAVTGADGWAMALITLLGLGGLVAGAVLLMRSRRSVTD